MCPQAYRYPVLTQLRTGPKKCRFSIPIGKNRIPRGPLDHGAPHNCVGCVVPKHATEWSPYTPTLMQLEQTTGSSGQRGTEPPTEPGFSQGFFSVLCLMEFWFLAVVASGLLSWGHFISSDITDLIADTI